MVNGNEIALEVGEKRIKLEKITGNAFARF
jgi:hypothetical protein